MALLLDRVGHPDGVADAFPHVHAMRPENSTVRRRHNALERHMHEGNSTAELHRHQLWNLSNGGDVSVRR